MSGEGTWCGLELVDSDNFIVKLVHTEESGLSLLQSVLSGTYLSLLGYLLSGALPKTGGGTFMVESSCIFIKIIL